MTSRFGSCFQYQFEALFRSIQLAFVDHFSHEYLFITDFFLVTNDEAIELHNKVSVFSRVFRLTNHVQAMARAMSVVLKSCEEQISLCWDAISLHLCLCLCDKFVEILAEREVPEVPDYWDTLTNFLWNRLNFVMSLHYESVKMVDLKKLQNSGSLDARPHFVRFWLIILVWKTWKTDQKTYRLSDDTPSWQVPIFLLQRPVGKRWETKWRQCWKTARTRLSSFLRECQRCSRHRRISTFFSLTITIWFCQLLTTTRASTARYTQLCMNWSRRVLMTLWRKCLSRTLVTW